MGRLARLRRQRRRPLGDDLLSTPSRSDADPDRVAWDRVAAVLARPGAVPSPARLAAHAGLDPSSLSAVCVRHRHADAARVVAEARLARARAALLETDEPPEAIADACGAGSARSLDRLFLNAYGVDAVGFRRTLGASTLSLRLPRDFRVGDTLGYLGRDPDSATQRVDGNRFALALAADAGAVRVDGEVERSRVTLEVSARGRLPATAGPEVLTTVARMFGLGTDVAGLAGRARRDTAIDRLVRHRPGLRIPCTATPFSALCWSIVGQQISLPFAYQLTHTLATLAGRPVPGGMRAPPTPQAMADVDPAALQAQRFSRAKARYLTDCAAQVVGRELSLSLPVDASAQALAERLLATRGLGPWSVNYILMRGFGLADCAPVGDAGLRRALAAFHGLDERPDDRRMGELMAPFSPHRSLATFHLWRSLDPASPL